MIDRASFPRPDFIRKDITILDGEWQFDFDDENLGLKEKWYVSHDYGKRITVPYPYQSELSGISDESIHPIMWYSCSISKMPNNGKRLFLCFGAVDNTADVFINGCHVSHHEGGYLPFSADITDYVKDEDDTITVRVEDYPDPSEIRGKQYWQKPDRCWYTGFSGIWQSVYLEERVDTYISSVKFIPSTVDNTVEVRVSLSTQYPKETKVSCLITLRDKVINESSLLIQGREGKTVISLHGDDFIDEDSYWSPDNPVLYDVLLKTETGDEVYSYFGLREIEIRNGIIYLNNRPLYQRLVLNQGYYPKGHSTPASIEDYKRDLLLTKEMGFNGVRMHQKIEDPHFYYFADTLGFLVWGELPSGYLFSEHEQKSVMNQMTAFIDRDFNHPSIITWVPFNESWGVRKISLNKEQQGFVEAIYSLIKSLDPTRLVDSNDGWEQVKSDILGIHDYARDGEALSSHWKRGIDTLDDTVGWRPIYAQNHHYSGEPILLTEFGGIALSTGEKEGEWGYDGIEKDSESFLKRLESLMLSIKENTLFQGFCYTQLTDVYQEINGLLDKDHNPKFNLQKIKELMKIPGRN